MLSNEEFLQVFPQVTCFFQHHEILYFEETIFSLWCHFRHEWFTKKLFNRKRSFLFKRTKDSKMLSTHFPSSGLKERSSFCFFLFCFSLTFCRERTRVEIMKRERERERGFWQRQIWKDDCFSRTTITLWRLLFFSKFLDCIVHDLHDDIKPALHASESQLRVPRKKLCRKKLCQNCSSDSFFVV